MKGEREGHGGSVGGRSVCSMMYIHTVIHVFIHSFVHSFIHIPLDYPPTHRPTHARTFMSAMFLSLERNQRSILVRA